MKKLILTIAAISGFSGSAFACSLRTLDTPTIREVVQRHGGWPISDEKCAVLNQNKLALFVTGQATVLSSVSIGWIELKLAHPDLNIVSDKVRYSTTVNSSKASIDAAEDLMYDSLRDAIAGLDFDAAASEVKQYQAKAARQLAAAPARR